MRLCARTLATTWLMLLPAAMPAQEPVAGPLVPVASDVRTRVAPRSELAVPRPAPGLSPLFVMHGRGAPAPSGLVGRQRVFVIGGAIAGAVVSGVLISRGKGLAPCSGGGTAAFCTTARVLVIGGGAGVGALLGYLASHAFP